MVLVDDKVGEVIRQRLLRPLLWCSRGLGSSRSSSRRLGGKETTQATCLKGQKHLLRAARLAHGARWGPQCPCL